MKRKEGGRRDEGDEVAREKEAVVAVAPSRGQRFCKRQRRKRQATRE